MYIQSSLVFLAAISSVQATAMLVQRAPQLENRAVSQGWSLQSSSAPSALHSCGNGAYCPISLNCNSMVNNHQVAACCTSSNDCRGEVSGSPNCADPSWNLWVGYDGNGFCCEEGQVGVYDISKSVAGTCVAPGNKGSLRDAVLTSTGTGASATSAPESGSSTASSVAAGTTSGTSARASGTSAASSSTVATTQASASPSSSSGSGSSTSSTVAVVPSSAGGSAANSTSSASPTGTGAAGTTGAGVRTTAGFSLMAVALVVVAML